MGVYAKTGRLLIFTAFSLVLLGSVSFASGIGTSSILVSPSNVTIAAGASGTANYTVHLVSGTVWGTSISVVNLANLSKDGINVSLSKTYADPTYTGVMTIKSSSTTKPGKYAIILNATGDDPSVSNAVFMVYVKSSSVNTTTTIAPTPVPSFTLYKSVTKTVNATKGANFSIKAIDGKLVNVTIPAGTYVKLNNKTLSSYNFTLALYNITNLSAPSSESSYLVTYGFAYLVNGLITTNASFVNATGADEPLITTAQYNSSWTSWTLLGGKQVNTSYVGGSYAFADVWTYNSTHNEIVNKQFFKPVMWVFLLKPPVVSTTSLTTILSTVTTVRPTTVPTTVPYTTAPSSSSTYIVVAIVIIIIIAIIAYAASKRNKK